MSYPYPYPHHVGPHAQPDHSYGSYYHEDDRDLTYSEQYPDMSMSDYQSEELHARTRITYHMTSSEATLVPANPDAAAHYKEKGRWPPSPPQSCPPAAPEAAFRGNDTQDPYSIAVGTPSYEFYDPRPQLSTSNFHNHSEVHLGYASFNNPSVDTFHNPPVPHHADGIWYPPNAKQSSRWSLHEEPLQHSQYGLKAPQNSRFSASGDSIYKQDIDSPTAKDADPDSTLVEQGRRKKDWRFWLILISLMVVAILTALDMTIISTALPTIVRDLPDSGISGTWITSAYLLTVTASQPAFGGLAAVAGRKWSLSLAVVIFLGGSILCALASNILFLCIGRGVQGLGGGGIQAIVEIIVSDLTTLRERGLFVGLIGLVFAISSFVAPVLGGAFSGSDWRWIFWINLPIGAISLMLIVPFINIKVAPMPRKEKLERMDLFGNLILFGSVVGILIGVTEGGIKHPWSDWRIYTPLAAGVAGFFIFLMVEFYPTFLCRRPVLPRRLFSNPTSASAFFQTFIHGIVTYGAIYTLPIFFQAIKDESALRSAISTFPATAPGAPFAIAAGIAMALSGKYRLSIWIGWAIMCAGFAWLTCFHVDTPRWELYTSQFTAGVGVGVLFTITLPPIQASLPVSELEAATATYAFCRSFGSIWGIALSTTIFTAAVDNRISEVPEAAMFGLRGSTALGFVEEIRNLPEPVRERVRVIFADALRYAFWSFVPLAIIGLISSFFIKELPLPDFIRSNAEVQSAERDEKRRETFTY